MTEWIVFLLGAICGACLGMLVVSLAHIAGEDPHGDED